MFPVLEDRRAQLAGSLSGGEQQMCAIGRALMARPRVLMLAEPTLGLAPVLVSRIFETVRYGRGAASASASSNSLAASCLSPVRS